MYGFVIMCTYGLLKHIWSNIVFILHICVREREVEKGLWMCFLMLVQDQ